MALSRLFVAFVACVALLVVAAAVRFLPPRYRLGGVSGLVAWTLCAGVLGMAGVLSNAALRPPGIAYVLLPTIALTIFLARSRAGAAIAATVPLGVLMGAQSMRLVVEVFLDRLWHAGVLPSIMTLRGGNYDILIGVSAPVFAALWAALRLDARVALAWNIFGIALLGNVVVRGILTSPAIHALKTDAPSAIGTFPFTFIPAFIVPLALMLHVVSIRAIVASLRKRTDNVAARIDDARAPSRRTAGL